MKENIMEESRELRLILMIELFGALTDKQQNVIIEKIKDLLSDE
jgi:hypothetical protein